MIRSQKLLDKLIADLHFHKFLFVNTSDNIFYEHNEHIDNLSKYIRILGLDNHLDPYVDFFHGGSVSTSSKDSHINHFIDDVFIDLFFRTHHFEEIVFPKGLCYEQITPNGIINPSDDIILNLNNIFDRCTFANNIWRLFGLDKFLSDIFKDNHFINNFYINNKVFGLHSSCGVLVNNKPFDKYFDEYILTKYRGNSNLDPTFRGQEVYNFIQFIKNESEHEIFNCSNYFLIELYEFQKGFLDIAENHIFGNYSIEDILFLYSLLTDKFIINEDSFLLSLCYCTNKESNIRILDEFINFEDQHLDYQVLEPHIIGHDLYLRFASHTKSKAYSFNHLNDVMDEILLFNKVSNQIVRHSNTMPLPYLYSKLTTK